MSFWTMSFGRPVFIDPKEIDKKCPPEFILKPGQNFICNF